jgi:hypothetical protein
VFVLPMSKSNIMVTLLFLPPASFLEDHIAAGDAL